MLFRSNKDDVVEQRRVTPGQSLVGGFRVIEKGLSAEDRVVVSTNGQAIAGNKVAPKLVTLQPPPAYRPNLAVPNQPDKK